MSPSRKRQLTAAEKRALALSPGLVVTRYRPDGERATVQQLAPESEERRRSFAMRLTRSDNDTAASEEVGS